MNEYFLAASDCNPSGAHAEVDGENQTGLNHQIPPRTASALRSSGLCLLLLLLYLILLFDFV